VLPAATERLRFRLWRDEDAEHVLRQFCDPLARRFYADVSTPEAAARWVAWMQARQAADGHSLWVLEALDDGRYLGDCGVLLQEVEGRPLHEVGYHLTAAERGLGFATEAARACLAFALERLGIPVVGSLVHPDNAASARVAARVHAAERAVRWRGQAYRLFFTRASEGRPDDGAPVD
jgi:RimJ/RimL family protein N-acetyltransferase